MADPDKRSLQFKQASNGDVVVALPAEALDPTDTVIALDVQSAE